MKKRLLAVFLCLAMLGALLSGCGKSASPAASSTADESPAAQTSTEQPPAEQPAVEQPAAEQAEETEAAADIEYQPVMTDETAAISRDLVQTASSVIAPRGAITKSQAFSSSRGFGLSHSCTATWMVLWAC